MKANQSRPWSGAEIEQVIAQLIERIEDGMAELREMGVKQANTEWAYKKAYALAMVDACETSKNADERTALATSATADAGLTRQLAENAYMDQRQILRLLDSELKVAQTLLVSAREHVDTKR